MPERIPKHEPSAQTPVVRWVSVQIIVAAAAFMLATKSTSWVEAFALGVFVSITVIAAVGAFWMIWAAVRHDHPIPKVILAAFVPFAFVWYYLKRGSRVERGHLTRVVRILLSGVAGTMIVLFIAQRLFGK